jgi:PD-(D/E)XK nuclease superfamily
MKRALSHSEVSSALDCQVRHSFQYTGNLTDRETLQPKSVAPKLRAGRAWGRAIAAWHENHDNEAQEHAIAAMTIALSLDQTEQLKHGVFDQAEFDALNSHLCDLLADYMSSAEPIPLTRPEYELHVPIPSRTGVRNSTVYELLCFLDGIHTDAQGRDWIVEFKLRGQLQSFELIAKQRQLRWYAWAWQKATGNPIAGIISEERLDATPTPVKLNKNGSVSKVQSCRPDMYIAAGGEDIDVLAKLEAKRWQQRHHLVLTAHELAEAGKQLASAGSLIQQLDTGSLFPIRNPSPMRCPGCAYRDVCVDPGDVALVDALFTRGVPKRDRQELAHAA